VAALALNPEAAFIARKKLEEAIRCMEEAQQILDPFWEKNDCDACGHARYDGWELYKADQSIGSLITKALGVVTKISSEQRIVELRGKE
jgi:hypothetical protein